MTITEERIEKMLRDVVFTNSAHKADLRNRLGSEVSELSDEDLGMVAGGVYVPETFVLLDDALEDK